MEAYTPITIHTTHVESQMENERGGKQRTDTVTSSLRQCWFRHLRGGEEREAQSECDKTRSFWERGVLIATGGAGISNGLACVLISAHPLTVEFRHENARIMAKLNNQGPGDKDGRKKKEARWAQSTR